MAFIANTDFFGLGDSTTLIVSDSADGRTAQNVTALKEDGSVGANTVFGDQFSPSNTYKIAGSVTKSIVLGGVTTADTSRKIMLGNVSIGTSAGGEPTFTASGEEVEANAQANSCTYTVSLAGLNQKRHAQTLFGAFAYTGTGCFLTEASYTVQATIGKATVDGDPVASDVTEGMIEASVTITQTGSTEPTLSAGTDWQITSPLACTNPDANYPTWTATLTKYLEKDAD